MNDGPSSPSPVRIKPPDRAAPLTAEELAAFTDGHAIPAALNDPHDPMFRLSKRSIQSLLPVMGLTIVLLAPSSLEGTLWSRDRLASLSMVGSAPGWMTFQNQFGMPEEALKPSDTPVLPEVTAAPLANPVLVVSTPSDDAPVWQSPSKSVIAKNSTGSPSTANSNPITQAPSAPIFTTTPASQTATITIRIEKLSNLIHAALKASARVGASRVSHSGSKGGQHW